MADELMDVTMPDGTVITDVPVGTTQAQLMSMYNKSSQKPSVWEAMKEGAKQAFSDEALTQYAKEIPPDAAARMAAPVRLATGLTRIPANLMSWAGIKEPLETVKAAEEGAKKFVQESGYTGMLPGAANVTGEAALGAGLLKLGSKAAPVLEAIPGGKTIVEGLRNSPLGQSIVGGMGLGAAGSTGTPYDIAKEATLGGMFGAAGHGLVTALGSMAAPVLKRYNELKALGYDDAQILKDTTIGQMLGGKTQALENILSDVPFGGVAQKIATGAQSLDEMLASKVGPLKQRAEAAADILDVTKKQLQTGEKRALSEAEKLAQRDLDARHAAEKAALKTTESDVHVPIINYALAPLGVEIKPGLTGNAAIREGQKAISEAYNTSLASFSNLRLNKATQSDLRALTDEYGEKYLGKENAELFRNDIERLINDTTKGKWLTPDNWQRNLSKLSTEAYKMRQKDPRYSDALYALKDKWMDLIENQVGSELFRNANTAFSKFKIPEKASAYAKSIKAGGEFSPDELVNAIKSELSTKRVAGGEEEVQQIALDAYNKMIKAREALATKHAAEKQGLSDTMLARTQGLEDKFTSMENALARQKAAIQGQAESKIGEHEAAIEAAKGPKTVGDYAGRRVGYALGAGSLGLGGYGLHHLGVDPLTSIALGGGTILGTRGLYSQPVQDLIKRVALFERGPMTRAIGETLKGTAPLAGLTAAQQGQSLRGKPEVEKKADGGLISLAQGGQPPKSNANEGSAFIGDSVPHYQVGKLVSSGLSDLMKVIRNERGATAAARLERAADLVPNLGNQYTSDALKEALSGGNRSGLIVLDPKDFQKFSTPLTAERKANPKGYRIGKPSDESGYANLPWGSYDEYIKQLQGHVQPGAGGFTGVPYFQLSSENNRLLPEIYGHEGRHRAEALAGLGEDSTLVKINPIGELKGQLGGETSEEFLENLRRKMGNPVLVRPQSNGPTSFRDPLDLPEIFKEGGLVGMSDGGDPATAPFIGYPHINKNRKIGSGTGFLDALVGAPPSRENILNPSDYSYMEGYEKGEPYGIAAMVAPFAGPAVKSIAKEAATRAFMGETLAPKMLGGLMPETAAFSAIKNPGGNWVDSRLKASLAHLKQEAPTFSTQLPLSQSAGNFIESVYPGTRQEYQNYFNSTGKHSMDYAKDFWPWLQQHQPEKAASILEGKTPAHALNKWIDTKLEKYVRNDLGTPNDPVRILADKGISHIKTLGEYPHTAGRLNQMAAKRTKHGFPEEGYATTPAGRDWEFASDEAIDPRNVKDFISDYFATTTRNPWISDLAEKNPKATINEFYADGLGFGHLFDELKNSIRQGTDLPQHLRLKPEALDRVTVPQAIEHVAKINAWRGAQIEKAAKESLADFPIVHEGGNGYNIHELRMPEKMPTELPSGYTLREINGEMRNHATGKTEKVTRYNVYDDKGYVAGTESYSPEKAIEEFNQKHHYNKLGQALKNEGEQMGHCVGSYCEDVASGKSRIFSLRDPKGAAHVTIEAIPAQHTKQSILALPVEAQDRIVQEVYGTPGLTMDKILKNLPTTGQRHALGVWRDIANKADELMPNPAQTINQIKGKQNGPVNEKYRKYIQDFLNKQSDKFGEVNDIRNVGLMDLKDPKNYSHRAQSHYQTGKLPRFISKEDLDNLPD